MSELKLRRGTFQHVEGELSAYHDTRMEIVRLKNDILHGRTSDDENVGGGRSSLPGDPTGRIGTMLATHKKVEHLQAIVDAIEAVVDKLPNDKRRMIELRYWTRPQILTWEGIARQIPAHRATVLRWRDEIITAIGVILGWR